MTGEEPDEAAQARNREEAVKRAREKATALLERLRTMVSTGVVSNKGKQVELLNEALDMAEAPGGPELLSVLGYVYIQEANMNRDTMFGIPAWFSKKNESIHLMKTSISMAASAAMYSSMEDDPEGMGADEETVMRQGLKTMWKMGKLVIEFEVREACEIMFKEMGIKKDEKKALVKALKLLGEIFKSTGDRVTKEMELAYYRMQQEQRRQQKQQQQQY